MADATDTNQTDRIEFGISMRLLKEVVAESQLAEQLGYDYLLTGEHISFYGPTPNTLISLSAAAAVTERIKLLSGIVLVPLYPAALLAKLIATLDTVSHGRYCFGIGIGGENPKEFDEAFAQFRRDGIGAMVHVTGSSGREQWNRVTTATGYGSSSDRTVYFGLGKDPSVKSIEISWPSGARQTLRDVATGRYLTVEEP